VHFSGARTRSRKLSIETIDLNGFKSLVRTVYVGGKELRTEHYWLSNTQTRIYRSKHSAATICHAANHA